ncbi:EF-hand domain-containing family member C2 [Cotesia typhae]|uniref:EF-hand domain-containing family member C2 n=1 Tax=Cotesia typhae TaxID=2053667 RepID=UPI003D681A1F
MEEKNSYRSLAVPPLPGYNTKAPAEKKNHHISQLFDKIHDGVYYLTERSSINQIRDPSFYPYDEEKRIPPWLAYDGQRLMFKAFFQQSDQERRESGRQIRVVTISFFLEDGTMKIVEPSVNNSGLEQGVLVRRQRIPMPDPVKYRFIDIIDLNIGKEPEIFGRVYKIVDCDIFTRRFLNRMGIAVPDPIEIPSDPYNDNRSIPVFPKKPNRKPDNLGKFFKYDRKVLKFTGYWDDTVSEYGVIHDLELRLYLADDTIEIKEILPANSARDMSSMSIKRMKIPKFYSGVDPIGVNDPFTVLNVLGESTEQSYLIADSLNTGKLANEYYKDSDLAIGVRINVFGREVVITDLDPATREYYRNKYGIEEFKPLERPDTKHDYYCTSAEKYKPPPYNGFGSYDDSLGNCFRVVPKPPKLDYVRLFSYDKEDKDSHILRFGARMISEVPENADRLFVINTYLQDNTISIFELAPKNTGFQQCYFQKRIKVMLPEQKVYSSDKPKFYDPCSFYVGARLNLGKFIFEITSADDYAIHYMENNCEKFPKANTNLIIDKIRAALKPVYGRFIQEFRPITQVSGTLVLSYDKLREALYKYLGNDIVEHEIITTARHYAMKEKPERDLREDIRRLIHNELKRFLWDDLDRLEEDIKHWDPAGSGFLPPSQVYTILRGCRIPVDPKLIDEMLKRINKNEEGKIDCRDLIQYLDVKINPVAPIVPMSLKTSLGWVSEDKDYCPGLDWCKFLADLGISEDNPVSAIPETQ